jgi:HAE1 family hydrophobic/amphiphilic exporter-1
VPAPSPENVAGVPIIAAGYRSNDRSLPELGRVGVDVMDQRTLTLREAIELAMANNRDIEVSRKTETISEYDLKIARAVFQPRLSGYSTTDNSTVANTSIFGNNLTTGQGTIVGNATLQGYYPRFGTIISSNLNTGRTTSDNPVTLLSPQYNANLGFSITQPLFRGRSFDVPRRNIEIAKRNITITDTQFRQRSLDVVAGVEKAYWDLTYALRNLQVQRDAVRDARAQLEHNQRLVREGQLAPIDVVAAETQVANFEQAVYDALNVVNVNENALKNLMAPNRNDQIWNEMLTPAEPVEVTVPDPTLTDAMATALENRPELEINQTQKAINRIDQKLYREQKKPQFDLIASYTSYGIGGTLNPNFVNPLTRGICQNPQDPQCIAAMAAQQALLHQLGSPASAFTDIFQLKYPAFHLGFQFNLPVFGDKAAEAELGRTLVEADRLNVQREQLEQGIQVEVRNALQAVRTGEARLRSAAISRENSARQYESEQRKLDNGQSDIYRVLERQTALATAQSNELKARTDLNKAIADLQHATGRSLAENGIDIVGK